MFHWFKISSRPLTTTFVASKKVPSTLKARRKSSQDWLFRHINDEYVKKAKKENYRARSAYKLIEINDKFDVLKPGDTVVELGAAPGAWTQVCVDKTNASEKNPNLPIGKHIAVDLLPMYPIKGAVILTPTDFRKSSTVAAILEKLDGQLVDVILSDLAPAASGIQELDHDSIINLAISVLELSRKISKDGGILLLKIWNGGRMSKLIKDLESIYTYTKIIKPQSSRQDSAELFLLAKNFKRA